ncbi:hypothetical protein NQ317_002098, partial [Molorchus minor]
LGRRHPFLYGAPRALTSLASSASASASAPREPISHIIDLRMKQQKAEKLQAEKQLAEDDGGLLEEEEDDEATNEASPSLFQKKVGKILTKLRIITALTNVGNSGNTDRQKEVEDLDASRALEDNREENNTDKDIPTFQKVIYPRPGLAKPIRFQLDVNERLTDAADDQAGNEDETAGRLGQIGMFFAELIGSIVGLVYGAAAQVDNSLHGTTSATIE